MKPRGIWLEPMKGPGREKGGTNRGSDEKVANNDGPKKGAERKIHLGETFSNH